MSYQVIVQTRAQRDLNYIYDWLAERSPEGARRWLDRWKECLRLLAENPVRFGLAPESASVTAEIRQIIFKTRRGRPFRALFWIDGTSVQVLHIRGPGQAPVPPDELQ